MPREDLFGLQKFYMGIESETQNYSKFSDKLSTADVRHQKEETPTFVNSSNHTGMKSH
jgi:hypothetical protein